MVEFNGYISGKSEKYYWNKSRRIVQICFLLAALVLLPMMVILSLNFKSWWILIAHCLLYFIGVPVLTIIIPIGKKQRFDFTPKRIFTNGDYIVCEGNKYKESRLIYDVRKVIDHGEFYELLFPFGKKSEKFICQKELLSKGTLEEFEALFIGKIQRM